MFIGLMLFGSDKIPEIARSMGKMMAQLKNATNDLKSEIQKGADANGLDAKSLTDITSSISSEITKAKDNLLNETNATSDKIKSEIDDIEGPIKRNL
jgi:sec-independent protein translocase protein TatA